jgi:glycosyltransferase involved in cell wall biosynthesis
LYCLYIVIPCYNEKDVLPETSVRVGKLLRDLISSGRVKPDSRVVFVDDGSRDGTWEIISALHGEDGIFSGVKLSRNRGHQNALLAGLLEGSENADVTVSMDADLQDDMTAIYEMLDKYEAGSQVVYGVRSARDTDTGFKKFTAEGFYKLTAALGGEVVYNHADFRLLGRNALDALAEFGEKNFFLRGIVPMLGYKSDIVYYKREKRFAGESKYSLKKMLSFAADGITSLSIKPLRIMGLIGILLLVLCGCTSVFIRGNAQIIVTVWAAAGLLLAALSLVGEYVGKTYIETKQRPRYIIETILK